MLNDPVKLNMMKANNVDNEIIAVIVAKIEIRSLIKCNYTFNYYC